MEGRSFCIESIQQSVYGLGASWKSALYDLQRKDSISGFFGSLIEKFKIRTDRMLVF